MYKKKMKTLSKHLIESLDEGTSSLLITLNEIDDDMEMVMNDWLEYATPDKWGKQIENAWKNDKKLLIPRSKPNFENPDDEKNYKILIKTAKDLTKDLDDSVKTAIKHLKEFKTVNDRDDDDVFDDLQELGRVWVQMMDDMTEQAEQLEELSNEISKYYF